MVLYSTVAPFQDPEIPTDCTQSPYMLSPGNQTWFARFQLFLVSNRPLKAKGFSVAMFWNHRRVLANISIGISGSESEGTVLYKVIFSGEIP